MSGKPRGGAGRRGPRRGAAWRVFRPAAAVVLCAAALGWGGGAGAGAQGSDVPAELHARPASCGFCSRPEGALVIDRGEAAMDALCRRMTAVNDSMWLRCNRLLETGAFGEPRSAEARRRTLTHFLLRSRNAMHYLAELGGDSYLNRVTESALTRPFGAWYGNTAVFPIRTLDEGLIGQEAFCLRYVFGEPFDQKLMLGGVLLRIRSDQVQESEEADPEPALSVEFGSTLHKSITLQFLSEVCGRVRSETIVDRGDTLELITLSDIEGMYVRRAGAHRLSALAFWRSVTTGDRDPVRPRAGACAYFPRISIGMPFFLPDVGLEDLRDFDLPSPVASMDWVRTHPFTPWMTISPEAYYSPWKSIGPRPVEMDRRFPDL